MSKGQRWKLIILLHENNSYLLHTHYSSFHRATLIPAADWTMQISGSNPKKTNKFGDQN